MGVVGTYAATKMRDRNIWANQEAAEAVEAALLEEEHGDREEIRNVVPGDRDRRIRNAVFLDSEVLI